MSKFLVRHLLSFVPRLLSLVFCPLSLVPCLLSFVQYVKDLLVIGREGSKVGVKGKNRNY